MRRSVNEWFGNYARDHHNDTNRLIHWICVPVMLWAVLALFWVIPVPPSIGRPGLWAGMAMVLAAVFYFRLSRPLGLAMVAVFVVLGLITEGLYRTIGPQALLWLAIGLFVASWIGQFIGHKIEGAKPSFLTDLAYLLIGPAWLTGKLMRRLHIAY
ncbi:MAG: Mpo1-like protein [Dokdonella sp.]